MIGNIESGKAKPSFENILKIAAALKIHPADLFLRNASTTVTNTKKILKSKLLPQIENFIEKGTLVVHIAVIAVTTAVPATRPLRFLI